jgi:hypothetical protein
MDRHVRALGWWNMVFGILSVLIVLGTLIYAGGFQNLYIGLYDDVIATILTGSAIFHLVVGIPCIVLGYFTMRFRQWARSGLIVVSALNLLNAPIGPLLGAYGLWVLTVPETEPLFRVRKGSAAKDPQAKSRSIMRSRRADAGPH